MPSVVSLLIFSASELATNPPPAAPLTQIVGGVGLLLAGVLNLVGKLVGIINCFHRAIY